MSSLKAGSRNIRSLTRWGKFWITITIVSLLLYDLRWIYGVINRFQSIFASPNLYATVEPWRFWVDYVATGIIGNGLRLAATILALVAIYWVLGPKRRAFIEVKKTVALALSFEGIYWLLVLPLLIIELLFVGRAPLVMAAFIIQIIVSAPALIMLARKVWLYATPDMKEVLKWACVAAIAYLIGIWFNNVFRWFSMAQSAGIGFILTGYNGAGFLATMVTLTLSLIFAVDAFWVMFKNFVIFIIISALTNFLNFVILVEFWPITVLGLGLGMLRGRI
jgi:hypothetical protein